MNSQALSTLANTALRVVAVFGMQAMAVIGGSAIVAPDIPVWKAGVLSGIAATAQVLQKLASAFADDGKISQAELDSAFSNHSVPQSSNDN